jgi:hypothetical protein
VSITVTPGGKRVPDTSLLMRCDCGAFSMFALDQCASPKSAPVVIEVCRKSLMPVHDCRFAK